MFIVVFVVLAAAVVVGAACVAYVSFLSLLLSLVIFVALLILVPWLDVCVCFCCLIVVPRTRCACCFSMRAVVLLCFRYTWHSLATQFTASEVMALQERLGLSERTLETQNLGWSLFDGCWSCLMVVV